MNNKTLLTTTKHRFIILGIFIIFLLLMMWQHAYVYMYHDDYGYASLSYLGDFSDNIQGHNFTLLQMLNFIYDHYMVWGGRLIPFFSLLPLLRWDFWIFRVVQSIVLTLILFFSMKLILSVNHLEGKGWLVGVILISLYGLIPIQLHKDGTYWASASVLYVWPFLWIFCAGFLLNRSGPQSPLNPRTRLVLSALFFGIGLSQEQTFFVAFFMLLGFIITHLLEKREFCYLKVDLLGLFFLLAGFSVLILAPGNVVRANNMIYRDFYALSILQRIANQLPSYISIVFGEQNLMVYLFLLIANLSVLIYFHQETRHCKAAVIFLMVIQFAFLCLLVILRLGGEFVSRSPYLYKVVMWVNLVLYPSAWFWFIFLFFVSTPGFIFSLHKRSFILFGIFVGGMLAQLTSLVIPTINYRFALIFMFSLFPLLTHMTVVSFTALRFPVGKFIVLALLITFSLSNTWQILINYQQNSPIHLKNEQILISSRLDLERGENIQRIELHRLLDDQYSGAMPYMEGYDYINYWIRKYYQIPMEIELYWK